MKQIVLAWLLMVPLLQAATIRVPQDQATIQAGINAAVNGDTVLVGPGVWVENVNFDNKNLVLKSSDGRGATTIQPANPATHVIRIFGGQDTTTVVRGFRITGTTNGWGIYVNDADPMILECEIDNCTRNEDGAGIYFRLSGGLIKDCLIHHNHCSITGGGIAASGGPGKRARIINNMIYANTASSGPGIGCPGVTNVDVIGNVIYENIGSASLTGGVYINGSNCRIFNNTIVANTKGITLLDGANTDVRNNIVAFSQSTGIELAAATSDYNCTWSNGTGNSPGAHGFHANPLFVSTAADSFYLQSTSPCIDTGDPDPQFNDPNGTRNDMGALPYLSPNKLREVPAEYPTIQAAINAAVNSDTVLVSDGHYYERISFLGKKITVASNYLLDSDTMHIYQTIIDGDTNIVPMIADTGCVVRFVNDEDSNSVLVGFTVQNGIGVDRLGSGILAMSSGPLVIRNRIRENDYAGIYAGSNSGYNAKLYIRHCDISMNRGQGIHCDHNVGAMLENTKIANNIGYGFWCYWWYVVSHCRFEANMGGGMIILYTDSWTSRDAGDITLYKLLGTEFVNNRSGIDLFYDRTYYIDSCLFESNTLYGIGVNTDSRAIVSNCVLRGNGNGTGNGGAVRFGDEVGGVACANTLFDGNSAEYGGAIGQSGNMPYDIVLSNCAFVNNSASWGAALFQSYKIARNSIVEKCVFVGNTGGPVVFRSLSPDTSQWSDSLRFAFSCTDIFGNESGDWGGQLAPQLGVNGNISAPPLFCDTASGDYRIKDSSPCAPANNSCGVLIGAFGIGCANIAPALTSANSAQAVSGLGFVYKAASTDSDGPATNYSFINRPSWLTANGDSVFGIPPLTDVDTSFVVIVSDGFLADSQLVTMEITESPTISVLTTEGVAVAMNVISHTPTFGWQYFDATGSYPQTQFEIAVGSDSDWTHAELWNPAPFNGNATSRQYAGAALVDGQTYWVRARVRNALIWSNWKQTSFRMNSVPTAPQLRLPGNNNIVASQFPNLTIRNPIDAESDSMFLIFEISADSFATSYFPFQVAPGNDSLTTVAVPVLLNENVRFWWRVKGSDYYEESAYSPIWSFWINSGNTAPSAFGLLSPPNAQSPALADNTPEFTWQPSFDFDPGDSVKFTMQLSIDAAFSFASQIPGLTVPQYTPASPLEWGRRYWWRVKAEDKATGLTWSNEVFTFTVMRLGDPDGNGMVTISDAVFLINYIFAGGPAPNPLLSGDADCNGIVTISDAVYLINYIFAGGPAPCE